MCSLQIDLLVTGNLRIETGYTLAPAAIMFDDTADGPIVRREKVPDQVGSPVTRSDHGYA